ncbi:MAG: nuclear transport factor 2 family protein [Actinomycetota bacterium]|nr:nuclear transport factor 2 family protein [Actinomycetota bacterium]
MLIKTCLDSPQLSVGHRVVGGHHEHESGGLERDTARAMSQENVEIVRRGYAPLVQGLNRGEFERGGFAALFEWLDPEIDWRGPREFPDLAEPRFGHEGVREYIAILNQAIEDYRMTAEEFIDAGGDQVLVFSREGGRGRGSGAEVQTHPTAHLWTLRAGKAVRLRSYWERSEALEAAGLKK